MDGAPEGVHVCLGQMVIAEAVSKQREAVAALAVYPEAGAGEARVTAARREGPAGVAGEPNDGNAHYFWHDVSGHAGLFGTVQALAGLGRFYLTTNDPVYLGGVTPQPGCEGRCLVFHTGGSF